MTLFPYTTLFRSYFFLDLFVPCQRNLFCIVSNFLIICLGARYKDKVYKGIYDNTALSKVSRPPNDSNCPCQCWSLLSTLSTQNCQLSLDNFLSLRGKPKYLNGKIPSLHCNVFAKLLSRVLIL